jgi:hypothetical protein
LDSFVEEEAEEVPESFDEAIERLGGMASKFTK